jgi:hypothetical protein
MGASYPATGAAVPVYRFYYLGSADRVAATEVIHCDTDAQAQARADRLLAASDHAGIEVWDRSQVVYRARKTDTPRPPSSST